ncbi:DUF3152 domain-containing protein [Streptomyces luteolifulvus]|uniref:DUF3152 domain-containing protein n=2 Tax=Streptomyces luteolifulvus TaxID=2615112 RepID=A0A6H9V154_9ACTN|nr:DUF3152 domain-containing protein [Streptomyces luteolifulvus]
MPGFQEGAPAHGAQGFQEGAPAHGAQGFQEGAPAHGARGFQEGAPAHGARGFQEGAPAHGVPGFPEGAPAHGMPRFPEGTPARGFPRLPDGTPAHRSPRMPEEGTPGRGFPRTPEEGTPARGFPRLPNDGTPARGIPRLPDGSPAHGAPRLPDATPSHGFPRVRGGHPEQREHGGGWGELGGHAADGYAGRTEAPRRPQRSAPAGPHHAHVNAFDEDVDVFAPRTPVPAADGPVDPYASVTDWDALPEPGARPTEGDASPQGEPAGSQGSKGRTFTGIAAAAVTTVLAVVVAGQVAGGHDDTAAPSQSASDQARDARDPASRGDGRPTPSGAPGPALLTYDQKMGKAYALSPALQGSGRFDAVPGIDKAPGTGQKYTYRVDVEEGLGLDGELFAQAVQETLNDDRSWAHNGARTFERIHSGKPDFVITLASPGTTATWCAKSGLDTTEDNVSCDSASTERVMINAYRWAQGSTTYGDRIHAYRQMLINHEVGHRLGYSHVTCDKDGESAPVMQQQTKFLDHDGIHCRANPWPYPGSS